MKKYKFGLLAVLFVLGLFVFDTKASAITASSSDCAINNTLKIGSTGNEVTCLQTRLGVPADGKFGPKTRAAVVSFQANSGLTADGVVGAKSRAVFDTNTDVSASIFITIPDGCTSDFKYSPITGELCRKTTPPIYDSSITVLSPNGGETWIKGTTQKIKWNTSSVSEKATIIINKLNDCVGTANTGCTLWYSAEVFKIGVPNTGSYSWYVPTTFADGRYILNIKIVDSSGIIQDESDSYFKIVSTSTTPSVTVLSPNGGETWTKGTIQKIKWIGAGDANTQSKSNRYIISLASSTGSAYTIANIPTTEGSSYSWSVGQTWETSIVPNGLYKVKVFQTGPPDNYWDLSDDYFTITSNPTGSSITVLSPNGGETWTKGTIQTIRWKNNNDDINNTASYIIYLKSQNAGEDGGNYPLSLSTKGNSYKWTVGNVMNGMGPNDGQYKIEVCQKGTTNCDSSDNYFTTTSGIPTSYITVISPNGGEVFTKGTSLNTGDFLRHKSEFYSQKIGNVCNYLIAKSNINNISTEKYWIPLGCANGYNPSKNGVTTDSGSTQINNVYDPGQYYFISTWQSQDYDEILYDVSDDYFEITSSTTDATPTISFKSPEPGSTWVKDSSQKIYFSTANIPSTARYDVVLYYAGGGASSYVPPVILLQNSATLPNPLSTIVPDVPTGQYYISARAVVGMNSYEAKSGNINISNQ